MPEMMDCIGADGVFTADFASAAMTHLGDGYIEADGKPRCAAIDDVKDIGALVKITADFRSKITKLQEQLGTALVRPGDDADDTRRHWCGRRDGRYPAGSRRDATYCMDDIGRSIRRLHRAGRCFFQS
ncbi:hypothetical protein LCGC14_1592810 [marine sediment metagenome]|uniref:Uncharacterized protein n=1 Tax=marine sediment metagenome TaxID=412755 RepID=A0A0F9KU75_9ZZZZ